jgi:DnaJ-domain-containing protein 1
MVYKKAKQKKQQQQYYNYYSQSQSSNQSSETESQGPLTLDDACRLLGVSSNASLEDATRAYKEKMIKSHPDKVSHLSEELQEKAKELTLKLNEAYDLIKKYKK